MEYKRNCPICNKVLKYKNESGLLCAKEKNSICISCATKVAERSRTYTKINDNYVRNCPKCNSIIKYKNNLEFEIANNYNSMCRNCVDINFTFNVKFIRNCPQCNKEIIYKNETKFMLAQHSDKICKNCAIKKSRTGLLSGSNNPMYGKSVYSVWLEKYGKEIADKKEKIMKEKISVTVKNYTKEKKEKIIDKCKKQGSNNGMYGKSVYSVWLEKYGKEEADKKYKQMIEKQSQRTSGKNNPMYGKPSPRGAGNGWSGYYKNIYFRSILEFNYLKYLFDNDIKFENGEKSQYKISYETTRGIFNYHPDFYLIDTQEVIEIKPKKLINTYINKRKFQTAKEKLGNKYKILTEDNIKMLDINELYILYINKEIIFDKKSEEKFLKYYEKR